MAKGKDKDPPKKQAKPMGKAKVTVAAKKADPPKAAKKADPPKAAKKDGKQVVAVKKTTTTSAKLQADKDKKNQKPAKTTKSLQAQQKAKDNKKDKPKAPTNLAKLQEKHRQARDTANREVRSSARRGFGSAMSSSDKGKLADEAKARQDALKLRRQQNTRSEIQKVARANMTPAERAANKSLLRGRGTESRKEVNRARVLAGKDPLDKKTYNQHQKKTAAAGGATHKNPTPTKPTTTTNGTTKPTTTTPPKPATTPPKPATTPPKPATTPTTATPPKPATTPTPSTPATPPKPTGDTTPEPKPDNWIQGA